jgi:hypothetical protein
MYIALGLPAPSLITSFATTCAPKSAPDSKIEAVKAGAERHFLASLLNFGLWGVNKRED